jgi:SPX domain protein involved in polyphosphate accumulation
MNSYDFEVKYIAPNIKASAINAWMDANMLPDGDYPETIISSIYFETKDQQFLREKEASDHIKSKLRIRWYENAQDGSHSKTCFLEFKHKVNLRRYKRRMEVLNTFSKIELESQDFSHCLDEFRIFNKNLLKPVFPFFTISYTRKRYIIPSTQQRICIDYNIHLKNVNKHMISKNIKSINLSNCVLETKGLDNTLPRQLHFLENFGLKKNSFSKYERCYYELLYEG